MKIKDGTPIYESNSGMVVKYVTMHGMNKGKLEIHLFIKTRIFINYLSLFLFVF